MLEKIKEGLLPIIASFECHLDSMEYVKEKGDGIYVSSLKRMMEILTWILALQSVKL